MPNAFLTIRTVFFALLVYFHVLILVFASWNIGAAKAFGMPAPGASVSLLINAIFVFVLVPLTCLAELICVKGRPAHVKVECSWTALMSIFQLAISIDVTVNGPPMHCQAQSPWALCASSSLLVHVSWLVTLILVSYCLAICVAATTHANAIPHIWSTPVPRVPWFCLGDGALVPVAMSHLPTHDRPRLPSSASEAFCALSKYIAERWEKLSHTERQLAQPGPTKRRQSDDPARPTWARVQPVRRGVDNPFTKAKPLLPENGDPVVLKPPPRTYSRRSMESWDSRFIKASKQSESARSQSTLASETFTFPQRLADPDLPVPHPRLSQWVRADVASGMLAPEDHSLHPAFSV